MRAALLLLLALAGVVLATYPGPDPVYDHVRNASLRPRNELRNSSCAQQTATYTSKYQPLLQPNVNLTMTPFFSPDHSVEVQTWLIGVRFRIASLTAAR